VRRGLQRQWRKSLAGIALLLALGQTPALATTISVDEACTLIGATRLTNTDATGGCTVGRTVDSTHARP
jgi:hypothetical protein